MSGTRGCARKKRGLVDSHISRCGITCVKAFNYTDNEKDMLEYYRKYQVLHIKNYLSCTDVKCKSLDVADMKQLYQQEPKMVNDTYTIETKNGLNGYSTYSSEDILNINAVSSRDDAWYCSFIVQSGKASDDMTRRNIATFQDKLPFLSLPMFKHLSRSSSYAGMDSSSKTTIHTDPIWVFCGRNGKGKGDNDGTMDDTSYLHGRPEHVDSVTHDGTWHAQCQGSKIWYLRPAEVDEWNDPDCSGSNGVDLQLNTTGRKGSPGGESGVVKCDDSMLRLKVTVRQGDVFMINTRVWWHQTRIPVMSGSRPYSLSYARDFHSPLLRLPGNTLPLYEKEHESKNSHSGGKSGQKRKLASTTSRDLLKDELTSSSAGYTNIDGLYASKRIRKGEVILTEADMPDCSLPRATTSSPTCEIAYDDEDGGMIVAAKDMQVGDWFTIAPSDSEEDEEEDEEDEEEEEEDEDT